MTASFNSGGKDLPHTQAVLSCGYCTQTGPAEEMCEKHLNCSPDGGIQVLKPVVSTVSKYLPFDH